MENMKWKDGRNVHMKERHDGINIKCVLKYLLSLRKDVIQY